MILQHDKARPHIAQLVETYLEKLKWQVLPHPPYSPDIAPPDYYLFRSMAHGLADQQFRSPYSPRFLHAMLFLDYTLSVNDSKLRIVFLSTPCKRGAKETTISNLRHMLFKKQHFFCRYFGKSLPEINI